MGAGATYGPCVGSGSAGARLSGLAKGTCIPRPPVVSSIRDNAFLGKVPPAQTPDAHLTETF